MKLSGKMLVAQLPMVAALMVIAASALYLTVRFALAPSEIMHENFRSFDAGRAMLRAVDGIDTEVLSASLQDRAVSATTLSTLQDSFDRELRLQENNITEDGEHAATERVRRAWTTYRAGLEGRPHPNGLAAHRARSVELQAAIETILEMNRSAMGRKSDEARRVAQRVVSLLALTAVVTLVAAVLVSAAWIRRTVAPVRVLERAVQRVSEGDFGASIRFHGSDEIALLSSSFNTMAAHLEQYRQSSVGRLMEANNRLVSVINSLPDAVVVYDLDGKPVVCNELANRLLSSDGIALDSLPERLRGAVTDAFEAVRRTGDPYEPTSLEAAVELQDSPRWLLVVGTPTRTENDALSAITIALRDVTRARRIEAFSGDLVAAAAHELRTPLTSLHMAVHLCLEQAAGPLNAKQEDLLNAARQDCERLQAVIEELLEMARLQGGATRLTRSLVNWFATPRVGMRPEPGNVEGPWRSFPAMVCCPSRPTQHGFGTCSTT